MAGTVIDALFVTLGLDPKNFKKGAKDTQASLDAIGESADKTQSRLDKSSKRGAKGVEQSQTGVRKHLAATEKQAGRTASTLKAKGKEGAEFFDTLTDGALAFLGILGAIKGVQDGLKMIATTAAVGRMAGNIGMPVENLTAWGLAASRYGGGDAQAAQSSVAGLEQQLQAFRTTGQQSQPVALLQSMGVSPYATTQQALMGVAKWMGSHSQQEDYTRGKMLGLDDGLINILEKGRGAVSKYLASVAPDATTDAQTQAMIKLQTAFVQTTQDIDAAGRALITEFATPLQNILGLISQFGTYSTDILGPILRADAKLLGDVTSGKWASVPGDVSSVVAADQNGLQKVLVPAKPLADAIDYPVYSALVNATTSQKQKLTRDQLMKALMDGGMSKAVAAGFVGNAMRESSLNPGVSATYDAKTGQHYHGLWQVSDVIRAQIIKGVGIDMDKSSAAQQAKGLLWYLKNSHDGALAYKKINAQSKDAVSAGLAVNSNFEVSADGAFGMAARAAYAMNAYNSYDIGSIAKDKKIIALDDALRQAQMHTVHSQLNSIKAAHLANYGLSSADNSTHSETHIQSVTIHTQAKDARGVAKVVQGLGSSQSRAITANTGLN